MAEEMYYYCEVCNKPISARLMRCNGCGRRFANANKYTMVQIEELQQKKIVAEEKKETGEEVVTSATVKEEAENGARLQCPICQKSYDVNHTVCDDCGMPLVMIYEPIVVPEEECVTENGLIFGAEILEPTWALRAKRFVDNIADGESTIVINRAIMPMGRRYLVENQVFSTDMMAAAQSLRKVSTDNAFFIVDGDALYIQYDETKMHDKNGAKKAAIKINGEMLLPKTRKRLTIHDRITFGYVQQSNKEGCVQFDVLRHQAKDAGAVDLSEIQKKLDIIIEKEDIIIEKVYELGDLDITKFKKEDLDKYIAVLEGYERQHRDTERSRDEYIDEFLKECPCKDEFLAILNESQKENLYFAAFYEEKAMEFKGEGMDYAAASLYLGKLLEEFVNIALVPLAKKFNSTKWEKKESENKSGKLYMIGDLTKHFTFIRDGECFVHDDVINRMMEEYQCIESDKNLNDLRAIMEQAFKDCDKSRFYRNIAAHFTGIHVYFDEYMQAKNHLLKKDFLVRIYHYYEKLTK